MEPNDIDILCDANTATLIDAVLAAYKVPFAGAVKRDKFRSVFSRYQIEGCMVELMGSLEVNTPGGWVDVLGVLQQIEKVMLGNKTFRVPGKQNQLTIYHLFGRDKDKAIIEMLNRP